MTIQRKYIKKGHVFTVELPENPSTGYSWNAEWTKCLKVIEDKYEASKNGAIGAPGKHIWRIKAEKNGLQFFNAYYQKPWTEDYAKSYELIVIVC